MSQPNELMLQCGSIGKGDDKRAPIDQLIIAGWTGRDPAAVEKHIHELEELGVPRPKRTPIFYRVGASLLTTAEEIQVVGGDASGEVEFVLFSLADELWVGVGSDHTDRKVETIGLLFDLWRTQPEHLTVARHPLKIPPRSARPPLRKGAFWSPPLQKGGQGGFTPPRLI